jgi:hypothetical protein
LVENEQNRLEFINLKLLKRKSSLEEIRNYCKKTFLYSLIFFSKQEQYGKRIGEIDEEEIELKSLPNFVFVHLHKLEELLHHCTDCGSVPGRDKPNSKFNCILVASIKFFR